MSTVDKTTAILESLYQLNVADSYVVVPSGILAPGAKRDYWAALHSADTLKYRWSDSDPNTTWEAVQETPNMYFLVDTETLQLVAEFTLCNFTGKSAQVHFSMHPQNSSDLNIFLATTVTDTILSQWKDVVTLEDTFLDSIFGLTPVQNRVACIFIKKAGFKEMGTLISGTKYLNEVDNALLSVKTRVN